MEATIFLSRPQYVHNFKILFWNVNGIKTKLEKEIVQSMLLNYDVICLNEVKSSLPVSFPSYVTWKSAVRGPAERGGTTLMVKNYLSKYVMDIDTGIEDQIWVRFWNVPTCLFGFCYIPPPDSEYYSHELFTSIQEKLKASECQEYCVMGDMNARFGASVRELLSSVEVPNCDSVSYPVIPDNVHVPSENAFILSSICQETNMLVLNNIKLGGQHFLSSKTYRKGREWVSELDTCIMSPSVLSSVKQFSVLQRESLPSDHAPVALTMSLSTMDMKSLCTRAHHLGDHAVLYNETLKYKHVVRPVQWKDVDRDVFFRKLQVVQLPNEIDRSEDAAKVISNSLYGCVRSSVREVRVIVRDPAMGRWEQLLDDKHDLQLWRAINWKGEYENDIKPDCCPREDEFKCFYEHNFNGT